MPSVYYFPSGDGCSRRKLRQGGWRHEWCEPESTAVREVVRGPFSKPLLVCSTPFVLLNEANSGRILGHAHTGIPDPWAEYVAQQTQGCSQLGEENVAVLDNAYSKWGVPLCQGIPDPWRNRPCFLEASFDELNKYGNASSCDCFKSLNKYGNIPPQHIKRNYPKERGNTSTCEPTNCPRKYSKTQSLNCKCTPEISPQQFTEQLQPQLREKTAQTLCNPNSEKICFCDLQQNATFQLPTDKNSLKPYYNVQQNVPHQLPSNNNSLTPQEKPRKICPGCTPKRRGVFKSCCCKCERIKPTSPSTKRESKKRHCPISNCFRRPKKNQKESPNKNITNQNSYLVALPNSVPIADEQNLFLNCWQNCKCSCTPCKLICTNTNLQGSVQVQLPFICQCFHTTGNSTNDTSNNPANFPSSACNLPKFLPCPFDENTSSSEKNNSLDPSNTKSPQSQTKDEKLQVPGKHEPQKVDANKQTKKSKVNYANKQSDTGDLQGTKDHVEDERNKGRPIIQ